MGKARDLLEEIYLARFHLREHRREIGDSWRLGLAEEALNRARALTVDTVRGLIEAQGVIKLLV